MPFHASQSPGTQNILASEPEQVRDYETGQLRVDKVTGLNLYSVKILTISDGSSDLIVVRFPSSTSPVGLVLGQAVILDDLTITVYKIGDRQGISWRASKVASVTPTSTKASPAA